MGVMDLFEKFETFGAQAKTRPSIAARDQEQDHEEKQSAQPIEEIEPAFITYQAVSPGKKWTWTATGKIKSLYTSLKVPNKIKPHLDNIDVFNWFFTTFTNYVSNFYYKYPGTTFFAFYPVPDNLIEIIGTNELLFDMESNGVVMCYL